MTAAEKIRERLKRHHWYAGNADNNQDKALGTERFEEATACLAIVEAEPPEANGFKTFKLGDRVTKKSGSSWTGTVCGRYSTTLTPEGYAVESENEPGSVQIYPVGALEALCHSTKLSEPPADLVRTLVNALEEVNSEFLITGELGEIVDAALAAAKDARVL